MALTREQVEALITASERATGGEWYFTEDERTWQMFAEFGGMYAPHQIIKAPKKSKEYAEYWPNQVTSEFITQSRNIGPEIAQWALKLDTENRRMREALDKLLEVACGISRHTGYELCDEEWDALNKAMQALADIDAEGNGQ
ncbi:hypothetical protein [Alicyclobacillus fastidiosus]|uniref:Ead/Ea22-like family protein n=1 Tax=Alicyclobacillus fastidiosus TaxID=392011 RepID=A0ABV5AKM3_9BACL|nr:hypothetical protein [Alicyclobacillus fastidiosus]WEH09289.1 hypothetical protein PYS47_21875 [Alicyclobacillus fastidiosus]